MEQGAGTIRDGTDDRDVVGRVKEGDHAAWRHLVGEHVHLIVAICRSYGLACEAASQVNQMVWLRLVEHLPRIRTPDAVGGWIAATARAECIDPRYTAGRSGWVVAEVGPDGESRNGDTAGVATTGGDGAAGVAGAGAVAGDAAGATLSGQERVLVAAFGRMGSRCQRLLRLLMAVPGMSHAQIGAALDVAPEEVGGISASCLARLGRVAGLDAAAVRQTLGRLMVVDGGSVPDTWWGAADAAFSWFTLDADFAELVYDSRAARSGLRPRMRQVRYAAGAAGVEVALDARDGEVMLTGKVAPADPVTVTARWPGGTQSSEADDAGVFHIHGLPPRPLSLQLTSAPPVKTGWMLP
jgi:DNA-directed RNA polymerase specialized sigma24 family protein